jgi:hypothetical protein
VEFALEKLVVALADLPAAGRCAAISLNLLGDVDETVERCGVGFWLDRMYVGVAPPGRINSQIIPWANAFSPVLWPNSSLTPTRGMAGR